MTQRQQLYGGSILQLNIIDIVPTHYPASMMSSVSHQPLSMRPLGQNNSQQPSSLKAGPGKRAAKVTARADSTGAENTEGLVKHHHSVKKAQTASVVKRNLRERTRVQGVNQVGLRNFASLSRAVNEGSNEGLQSWRRPLLRPSSG